MPTANTLPATYEILSASKRVQSVVLNQCTFQLMSRARGSLFTTRARNRLLAAGTWTLRRCPVFQLFSEVAFLDSAAFIPIVLRGCMNLFAVQAYQRVHQIH